ncbi:MAG: response regulator transcription factor [Gammaproteobacteria bacterium]|nr:response regulator transcription factor [Gammaproteobacteria bacterium]MDH5799977.1 response regulator transcription factor [Gammaproteobacteria bacterium]
MDVADGNSAYDDNTLLLVDDDALFLQVLSRALSKQGFHCICASDAITAIEVAQCNPPQFAVVDLRLPGESGLVVVEKLVKLFPQIRVVVLTGFASINTAVEAIKLGAVQYLAKPANTQEIIQALSQDQGNSAAGIAEQPMSPNRLEWEHIQKVLADCGGNVSAAARTLGMHRRTLQRKLAKKPAKR